MSREHIGESHDDILEKVQWTSAIGECPLGERLIGKIQESRIFHYRLLYFVQ